jgi:NAD(P)-dependent dehydrogenase (short-subunit alcohol dehydrogenase family)
LRSSQSLSFQNVQPVAADMDDILLQESVLDLDLPHAQFWPFTGDLSLAQDIDDLFEFAVDRMGGIDLFFANAGIG